MRGCLVLLFACSSGPAPDAAPAPAEAASAGAAPAAAEAAPAGEAGATGSISGDPILAQPTVLGGVSAAEVGATLEAARPAIDACYTTAAAGDPGLAGKVLVRFAIGADGRVSSARVKATSLWHEGAEACILGTITSLAFPRPPADGTAIITWPFTFPPAATTPR